MKKLILLLSIVYSVSFAQNTVPITNTVTRPGAGQARPYVTPEGRFMIQPTAGSAFGVPTQVDLDQKFTAVSDTNALRALTSIVGSRVRYDGSDWIKKEGISGSDGGTRVKVDNNSYWERQYNSVTPEMFQITGDGITDISKALNVVGASSVELSEGVYRLSQKARIYNKTIIIKNNAKLQVDNELILDNCVLVVSNPLSITGAGLVRGVLSSDRVPVEAFGCRFNILLKKYRSDFVQSGAIYVDALLGEDANSGTSFLPLRTLGAAQARIQQLISQGLSTDLVVILKGGRYEFSSTLTLNVSIANKRIFIRANAGDKVQFTPVIDFFNSYTSAIDTYNGHKAFPHQIGSAFINLYNAETNEEIEIANSIGQNSVVFRNSRDSIQLNYVNSIPYASIYAPTDLRKTMESLTSQEITSAYIIAKQWFTSQWARVSGYTKSNGEITYKLDNAITRAGDYDGYVNGYYHYTKNRAPFYLGNIKSYAKDQNFFTTSSLVYLPKQEGVYFTPRKDLSTLIKITSASRITFEGIEFAYIGSSDTEMTSNYMAGMNTNTVINADNTDDLSILGCKFHHNNIANIYIKGNRFQLKNNTFESLGGGGAYVIGNGGNISYNQVHDINKLMLHQPGLVIDGAGDTTAYNVVDRCGYIGIRLANLPAMTQTHICYRNIIRNVGATENGQLDETRSLLDGGAMYVFGRNPTTSHIGTEIFENVIYNVYSEKEYRGIFYDDGVAGTYTHDNLIWNVGSYTLDLRQVNDRTKGNRMAKNILAGPIRYVGLIDNTTSNVFEPNNVILSTKNGIYTNTISAVSQYVFQKLDYNVGKDVLYIQPDELKGLGINIPAFIKTFIAPYTSNAAGSGGGGAASGYYNVKSYNLQGDGVADDATTLNTLLTTIGSEKVDMVFSKGTYVFNSSVTVPANVKVRMDNGAILAPSGSASITILGELVSALNPVVGGNGLVYLKGNGIIYPEWYGADAGNSASDYLAFKRMSSVFTTDPIEVSLTKGTYALSSANYSKNPSMTGDSNNDGVANDYFGANASFNGITKTFSVTADGQKIDYTASTANADWVGVKQNNTPVTPGQTYTFFAETKFTGNGYSSLILVQYVNATGTILGDGFAETRIPGPNFVPLKVTTTAPAGAVFANFTLRVNTRVAGQTGSVWFKNAYFVPGQDMVTNFDPITVPSNFRINLSSIASIGVPTGTTATLNAQIISANQQPFNVLGTLNGTYINTGLAEQKSIVSVSSNYALTLGNYTVLVNATSAETFITLPNASACKGYIYVIKKIDSSVNPVTVQTFSGQTIDGMSSRSLTTQYQSLRIQSDGTNWSIL